MRQQNSFNPAVDGEEKPSSSSAGHVEETKPHSARQPRIYYDALGSIVRIVIEPSAFSSVGQIDEARSNLTQGIITTYTYDVQGRLIETQTTVVDAKEHPQANHLFLDEPPPLDEEPDEAPFIGPASNGGLAHNVMGIFSQPAAAHGEGQAVLGAQPSATP